MTEMFDQGLPFLETSEYDSNNYSTQQRITSMYTAIRRVGRLTVSPEEFTLKSNLEEAIGL